jgi:hypothetical protein
MAAKASRALRSHNQPPEILSRLAEAIPEPRMPYRHAESLSRAV